MARLGVTQREVARACGVQSGALSKWLLGRHARTPQVLEAGAAATRWHEENKGRLA